MIAFSLFLFSCNKETPLKQKTETPKTENHDDVNDTDSAMTAEESFSSALVQDIMGENEDADLQYYLEEEIYEMVSKSEKVTLDRISSSLYLLSYYEGGTLKNFLIQKFYNPQKDEISFEKSETQSNTFKQFVK